ncbi:putative universal stress protein [compost metagenome]|jgi:nucleotide-binding universal stress UspA family protein|uniref:Universal stress protein n=1 Tax=Cupriavidus campinensis TaxID=151783 RepID=A0AAE9I638_9BURK|nr:MULTISPECIES: universal stress protein [Cupriavidus]TSP11932.1 universal stress protein [Cupriavidus campinensis]URF07433.1 universal stress protein [Cupriavidus campinensis]CAG2139561.1 Putative universal stress protein [Cupriavidus campinensis]
MYRHVLVAIDESQCARCALDEAIRLAFCCGARLEILHVINYAYLQYETGYGLRADVSPALVAAGNDLLRDAAGVADAAGVRHVETLIDEILNMGDVAGLVEKYVRSSRPDLVVVGTHGRHGLRRVLLGSVAEALARHCTVPVLLVHEVSHETAAPAPSRATL